MSAARFQLGARRLLDLLVDAAGDAGALSPPIDGGLLLRQLDLLFRSAMLDWVVGELEPHRLAPTIRYGPALMPRGAAADGWRGPLEARLLESQGAIGRVNSVRRRSTPTRRASNVLVLF